MNMMTSSVAWSNLGVQQREIKTVSDAIAFEEPRVAPWIPSAKRQIKNLLGLEHNWNGQGSLPVDNAVARFSNHLLDVLINVDTPEPSILPTVDGRIQFEWHINQYDLELEVLPNSDVVCYFEDLQSEEYVETVYSFDWAELSVYIGRLSLAR